MFMKSSQDQIRIAHFEWYLPFHNRNWDGEIDVFFLFSFTVGTSKKRGHWGCSTAKLDFFGVERLVMMDVLPRSWKDMILETWKWDVSWVTLSDLFKLAACRSGDPRVVCLQVRCTGPSWSPDCRYLVLAADLHSTKESWGIHVGTLQNRSWASTAHVYLLLGVSL